MNKEKENSTIISSWGNYQHIKSNIYCLESEALPLSLKKVTEYIPYGNGRSYGDCALNKNIVKTNSLNKILSFDDQSGIIHCQSGVLLIDILMLIIPKKWFLSVTPGTKYITIGGAIASDVHGKNHHKEGAFSDYVIGFKLVLPDGEIVFCSKTENTSLFRATCGGMGLTGVILEVALKLKPILSAYIDQKIIKTLNLKETFKAFENYSASTYSVAWVDGFAKSNQFGKSILFLGEHAQDNNVHFSFKQKIIIPQYFPTFLLNKYSNKLFNKLYYYKNKVKKEKISLDAFFYPLDGIGHWNRIYGRKGLMQYQFVIPKKQAYEGISKILEKVSKSKHVSYLTVLKLLGKENENFISFPFEGYTLTLDFKVKEGLLSFLDNLDAIVAEHEGRVYLAKDGRMRKEFFEKGYPKINEFKAIRKKHNLEQIQSLQSKRLGL